MTTRRAFLAGLGAGVVGAALPRGARAQTVSQPCNVLQIFLAGALSHRHTTWCRPGEPVPSLMMLEGPEQPTNFLADSGQNEALWLGRGFAPLTDHMDRMRLVAMKTEIGVHEIGYAYAMTGERLGRPAARSLGARIQALAGPTDVPASWILDGARIPILNQVATATGDLGAFSSPFILPAGSESIKERLLRTDIEAMDPLIDLYRNRYLQRLTHNAGLVRSNAFETYGDSLDRLIDWPSIHSRITQGNVNVDLEVDNSSYLDNRMTRGIEMGAKLITQGAKHVCVFGGGQATPGLDTHDNFPIFDAHYQHHNSILWAACNEIDKAVKGGYLELNDTLVMIHSEFGRYRDSNGSEHWTAGYAAALLGGPATARGRCGSLSFANDDYGIADGLALDSEQLIDAVSAAAGVDTSQLKTDDIEDVFERTFGHPLA